MYWNLSIGREKKRIFAWIALQIIRKFLLTTTLHDQISQTPWNSSRRYSLSVLFLLFCQYLGVIKHFFSPRAILNWGPKVKKRLHWRWSVHRRKTKTNATLSVESLAFSQASGKLLVFPLSYHWLIVTALKNYIKLWFSNYDTLKLKQ